jgi:enamine deaminase RidA (YjgF/YER057c/UK114 family)
MTSVRPSQPKHQARSSGCAANCQQHLDDADNIKNHGSIEQTHKVMQNIKQPIEEAGGNIIQMVKVVVYIADIRHRAGLVAGGEAGPVHSDGVKNVDTVSWPVADLSCDWT